MGDRRRRQLLRSAVIKLNVAARRNEGGHTATRSYVVMMVTSSATVALCVAFITLVVF